MPFLGTTGSGSVKQFGGQANLGYFIKNSLRLRNSASAYYNRTPASASNRQTWTWSGWVKRGLLTTRMPLMGGYTGTTNGTLRTDITILDGGALNVGSDQMQTATDFSLQTTQLFRDPAAWYHIVVAVDTTQGTSTNRVKIYVNGVQVTAFSTATYPSLNYQGGINYNNNQYINRWFDSSGGNYYGDGYLAEVNFIDGQQLTPSSFGKTDAATNQWIPKKYVGTYGTNGFYLKFADASAATAAAIGKDSSGNGNNWTPNNISVTSGVTYDAMIDSPTRSAAASNYCVLNPLDSPSVVLSNGNLQATYASASWKGVRASMAIPKTGQWKWEVIPTTMNYNFIAVAMASADLTTSGYTATNVFSWYLESGEIRYSNNNLVTVSATTANQVCEVRINNGAVSFYRDNVLLHTFTQTLSDISADYFPAHFVQSGGIVVYNFGQRPFTYTPTGYKSLNTFNLS